MRRRLAIPLALIISAYLDSILFNILNINGIRPDAMLVTVASAGVLMGSVKGGAIGLFAGLFMDILFNRYIGLSAIGYMITGAAGGFFYQKYYADNLIIPAAVVVGSALFKEHIMLIAVKISGVNPSYLKLLSAYILPCALFSGALSVPFHFLLKRALAGQVHSERRIRYKDIGGYR